MQFYLDGVLGRGPQIAEPSAQAHPHSDAVPLHLGEADGMARRTQAEPSVLFFNLWR